jgi:hypothetical protein
VAIVDAAIKVFCMNDWGRSTVDGSPDDAEASSITACCLLFLVGAWWDAWWTDSLTMRGAVPEFLAAWMTLVA